MKESTIITYSKPEVVDFRWMESLGLCMNGTNATVSEIASIGACADGIAPGIDNAGCANGISAGSCIVGTMAG